MLPALIGAVVFIVLFGLCLIMMDRHATLRERERCAKLCDNCAKKYYAYLWQGAQACAALIRNSK